MSPENSSTNKDLQSGSETAISAPPAVTPDQGVVAGGSNQPQTTISPTPPKTKGKFLGKFGKLPVLIAGIILLSSIGAAAYYGLILPNHPLMILKTSMNNTSKGLDKYLEYTQQLKDVKGSKFNGTFNADISGLIVDGSFEGRTYESNANIKADFGAAGSRVNLELLMNTPNGAKSPDVYMRVKGLEGLSSVLGTTDPSIAQLLVAVNNQWYVMDHTMIDQMYSSGGASGVSQITPEDSYNIQKVLVDVTNDYVLATSPDKAVMTVRQTVGKEEIDGRKLLHYKVGINKTNLKTYATTLKDELKKTKLGEMFKNPSFEEAMGFDGILKSIDEIKDEDTLDIWVDRETKLLRKVKVTDSKNEKTYFELSLAYNGGSSYPIILDLHNDDGSGASAATLKATLDTDKKNTTVEFNFEGSSSASKEKGGFKMTSEPSNEKVEFSKPADAKSFYELLGGLMGGARSGAALTGESGLGDFDL